LSELRSGAQNFSQSEWRDKEFIMDAKAQAQVRRGLQTRKHFVLWEGGVMFGGLATILNAGVELIRNHEQYVPLSPPTAHVYFNWLWLILVTPAIWFASGCLFGLLMWELVLKRRKNLKAE
jgi:hypothetical protein